MKYTHIIKPNIKHIYIRVDKNNNIILTSSSLMKHEAIKLLNKKKEWIKKAVKKNSLKQRKENIYEDKGTVYLFGKALELKFIFNEKETMLLDGTTLFYCGKKHLNPQKTVERFYKNELKNYIETKVKYFSKRLALYPKDIKYRKMKRRLGSCSYDNILTFNTLLAKLPKNEIDYVIVHELSHIKHKNHSKIFWEEVSKIFPNYKEIRKSITL